MITCAQGGCRETLKGWMRVHDGKLGIMVEDVKEAESWVFAAPGGEPTALCPYHAPQGPEPVEVGPWEGPKRVR